MIASLALPGFALPGFALPTQTLAADAPKTTAQTTPEKPSTASRLLSLPSSLLNRLPLPRIAQQPSRTAADAPSTSGPLELPAPGPNPATLEISQRSVERSRQLIADARQLEAGGHFEAALELARRANTIYSTTQAISPVPWPPGEELPDHYVASLAEKIVAARPDSRPVAGSAGGPAIAALPPDAALRASNSRMNDATLPVLIAIPAPAVATGTASASAPATASLSPQLRLPSLGQVEHGGQLLLDWGRRGIDAAETVQKVKQAVDEKRIDDLAGIALAGTGVVIEAVSATSTPVDAGQPAQGETHDINVRDLLRDQIKKLESWVPGQTAGSEPLKPLEDGDLTIPLMLPPQTAKTGQDYGSGRVSPIPTQITEPGHASAPVVTIPAQTLAQDALASEPGLLSPLPGDPASSPAQPGSPNVWYAALVQMLSTFAGVALALLAFVAVRSWLNRSTAASVAATATPVAQPAVSETSLDTDDASQDDASQDDVSHVVPFARTSDSAVSSTPARDGAAPDERRAA